ncbi:MAG: hypothetical protein NTZ26_07140 [Candidatus Aminicenantes bacterium]|nr:hypothetical protein [Candidatus Aminicenantes bacterium]
MHRTALFLLAPLLLGAAEPPQIRIQGAYLAFSYDHAQILGDDISLTWRGWTITAQAVKIDIAARAGSVIGRVRMAKGEARLEADEFLFDAGSETGVIVRYGDEISEIPFPADRKPQDLAAETKARRATLEGASWAKMRGSLLYASAKALDIMSSFEVYGDEILMHVEGVESVGFKRLKLSAGDKPQAGGLSLDRIWFSRNQGVFGDMSLTLNRDKVLRSRTLLHYEEHTILSSYIGLPRQLDAQTSNVWSASAKLDLGLEGNYSTTSLGNARVFALVKSRDDKRNTTFDLAYNKPLQSEGETWLGMRTELKSEGWGNLTISGRQERHDQTLADLTYAKDFGKRVHLGLDTRYSHFRIGGRGATASRILTGDIRLAYDAASYQAAAEYHLNDDLLGNRRLSRPQLQLAVKPVTFYGGLLTASLTNTLVLSALSDSTKTSQSYNDNAAFSLAAAPIRIRTGLTLRTSLSAEQFLEKEGRNFTSGGLILQAVQEFAPGVTLEVFYSAQSRRRTQGWLIEGTTSQNLTAAFRVRTGGRIDGWVSVAYDPKYGDWKQGFADVSLGLIKNWRIQSIFNYDFYAGRLANIDLYLVRRAGRFDLRFVWRSLSKQFLIELVPAIR